MTTTTEPTAKASGHRAKSPVAVLAISAIASLLLSPITAVWALLVGSSLVVIGGVASRLHPMSRGMLLMAAGAGVILGVLPYFVLAVIQA